MSTEKRVQRSSSVKGEGLERSLMKKVESEDVIRRSLLNRDEENGVLWLGNNLKKCYGPLLTIPWILDLDATVKPLYGKQEGAEGWLQS